MANSQSKLIVGKISEAKTTSVAELLGKDALESRISSVEDPVEVQVASARSAPLTASPTTLDRYREVIAFALSNAHDFPPEAIEHLLRTYEEVIRGSWSVGAVAADVIKLLYAEWHTFGTKSGA
ncbi:MAG: hypothetical protein E2591_27430 [Achromobacter sp.]|uniref:hypothetical protein n=1 Tax=Achromobacter sp. TaxID=134375 RepID=UPI0012C8AE6F|nr:hypothetical protein [Achromobacter sp.]MPS81804.1 hypothetical protein [Achromobacter sp.]